MKFNKVSEVILLLIFELPLLPLSFSIFLIWETGPVQTAFSLSS